MKIGDRFRTRTGHTFKQYSPYPPGSKTNAFVRTGIGSSNIYTFKTGIYENTVPAGTEMVVNSAPDSYGRVTLLAANNGKEVTTTVALLTNPGLADPVAVNTGVQVVKKTVDLVTSSGDIIKIPTGEIDVIDTTLPAPDAGPTPPANKNGFLPDSKTLLMLGGIAVAGYFLLKK